MFIHTTNNNQYQNQQNSINPSMKFPGAYPANGSFLNYQVQQEVSQQTKFNPTATHQNMEFPETTSDMNFPESNSYNSYATMNPLPIQTSFLENCTIAGYQNKPYKSDANPQPFVTYGPYVPVTSNTIIEHTVYLEEPKVDEKLVELESKQNGLRNLLNSLQIEIDDIDNKIKKTECSALNTINTDFQENLVSFISELYKQKTTKNKTIENCKNAFIDPDSKRCLLYSHQLDLAEVNNKIKIAEGSVSKTKNADYEAELALTISKLYNQKTKVIKKIENCENLLIEIDIKITEHKLSIVNVK